MRSIARFVVLASLVATAVAAQETDPNPPWTYAPLGLGDVRSYQPTKITESPFRTDIPATVTIDGHQWFVQRTQRFDRIEILQQPGWRRWESRVLVRYDTTAANVFTYQPGGGGRALYPCRLDLPVPPDSDVGMCGDGVFYDVNLDAVVRLGDRTVRTAVRSFDFFGGISLAAGIGKVDEYFDGGTSYYLVGATIDGDTLLSEPETYPQSRIDPIPGRQYVPLAVGNEWQYEYGRIGLADEIARYRVTDTEEIDGKTFFTVDVSTHVPESGGDWNVSQADLPIRYDLLSGYVVGREGQPSTLWPFFSPCPFDEPTSSEPYGENEVVFCRVGSDNGYGTYALGFGPADQIQETDVVVSSESFKQFAEWSIADGFSPGGYAANVGYLPDTQGAIGPVPYAGLSFARVRQPDGTFLEIGRRYAVSSGDRPRLETFVLTAVPTPTAGPLAVTLSGARAPVTVDVFDALGRRVWHAETHRQREEIDASGWAPGLYVVRATADGEVATAMVIRR